MNKRKKMIFSFQDLKQGYSDDFQISHEMEENTPIMDVETNLHLECQRIDRAIQTEGIDSGKYLQLVKSNIKISFNKFAFRKLIQAGKTFS
jgi:hypothetical protein